MEKKAFCSVLILILIFGMFIEVFAGSLTGAGLYWQGYEINVTGSSITKIEAGESFAGAEKYELLLDFEAPDISFIPDQTISVYAHEFVLTDGADRVFRPSGIKIDNENGAAFTLAYETDFYPDIINGGLKIDVWRRGALWFDEFYRKKAGAPFKYFIPDSPRANTYSLALEDHSMYKFDKGAAISDPEACFSELNADLKNIAAGIKNTFSGQPFALSDDPDSASVTIGVCVQYPLAGKYGAEGSIKAYNCVLTLTAYDAATHEKIAELATGSYFGSTITIAAGSSVTWKFIPSFDSFDETQKTDFINALKDFWNRR